MRLLKKRTLILTAAFLTAVLVGCTPAGSLSAVTSGSSSSAAVSTSSDTAASSAVSAVSTDDAAPTGEYSAGDLDGTWDSSTSVTVACSGTDAAVSGSGVTVENGVITITAAGTYVFTGSFSGQIVVNVADTEKVQLVLDGVYPCAP